MGKEKGRRVTCVAFAYGGGEEALYTVASGYSVLLAFAF